VGRAGPDVRWLLLAHHAGQAEIGDAGAAAAVDHHVGGLEVAVEHPAIVGGGEAGADLAGDLHGAVSREASDPPQQRAQVFPVDVLHGEERLALDLPHVVDAGDVGVAHLAGDAHLAEEAVEAPAVLGEGRGKELQRHRLVQLEVVGPVHLAHPAAADEAEDPVALQQDLPGHETGGHPALRDRQAPGRGDVGASRAHRGRTRGVIEDGARGAVRAEGRGFHRRPAARAEPGVLGENGRAGGTGDRVHRRTS
jgi:hypothetical protein